MSWDEEKLAVALELDAALCARLEDMTPAMQEARDLLVAQIEENFATESAAGDAWPELAESTIEDRIRKGFGAGPILERTGDLKAAATEHREVGRDYVEVGVQSGHPYAAFHASSAPRSKIPLRDFLAVSAETLDDIDAALAEHIDRE